MNVGCGVGVGRTNDGVGVGPGGVATGVGIIVAAALEGLARLAGSGTHATGNSAPARTRSVSRRVRISTVVTGLRLDG
jgi:hypothetical protein